MNEEDDLPFDRDRGHPPRRTETGVTVGFRLLGLQIHRTLFRGQTCSSGGLEVVVMSILPCRDALREGDFRVSERGNRECRLWRITSLRLSLDYTFRLHRVNCLPPNIRPRRILDRLSCTRVRRRADRSR
jgi:hypothetical protein